MFNSFIDQPLAGGDLESYVSQRSALKNYKIILECRVMAESAEDAVREGWARLQNVVPKGFEFDVVCEEDAAEPSAVIPHPDAIKE